MTLASTASDIHRAYRNFYCSFSTWNRAGHLIVCAEHILPFFMSLSKSSVCVCACVLLPFISRLSLFFLSASEICSGFLSNMHICVYNLSEMMLFGTRWSCLLYDARYEQSTQIQWNVSFCIHSISTMELFSKASCFVIFFCLMFHLNFIVAIHFYRQLLPASTTSHRFVL